MPRVLLVDDDPDIQETLRFALEHESCEVESVRDGHAVLEVARRFAPQVVLLDVMLPGANGYELSRLLRQETSAGRLPSFGIVILTARRVASAARREFLDTWSGADATLWKPFDVQVLLHEVRRLAAPIQGEP